MKKTIVTSLLIAFATIAIADERPCCPDKEGLLKSINENIDNEDYHYDSTAPANGDLAAFPPGTNKCNKFVNDQLYSNGYPVPQTDGWGPTAGEWASTNPNAVPGYEIVTNPQPGDVAAYTGDWAQPGATGHCGLVDENGDIISAHASSGPDSEGNWENENVVYRRLKAEENTCGEHQ